MTIEFLTSEYELSHGRAPRGRGSWAFSADRNPDACSSDILWSPSMTYAEAKRWARDECKRRGVSAPALWVLS